MRGKESNNAFFRAFLMLKTGLLFLVPATQLRLAPKNRLGEGNHLKKCILKGIQDKNSVA
jgi:hypothetical protein